MTAASESWRQAVLVGRLVAVTIGLLALGLIWYGAAQKPFQGFMFAARASD